MKKTTIITIAILLFISLTTSAQPDDKSKQKDFSTAINAYIQKTMEKLPGIPAIAVVVIKDDQPIFMQAYGVANKETGGKADTNTLFYIASSTKSFTALAAALLDRDGKIVLSDPMTKYAPDINFKEPIPEKITIRDLLTHTSGLQNDPLTFRLAYSGEVEKNDILRTFTDATSFVDSNYSKYKYDNLGYNIYTILLQQMININWKDLLQEKIFDPLGMKHTTAYFSKAKSKTYNVAAPYYFSGESGTTIRSPLDKRDNNMQSAGGIFASISDIGKWINMNMNAGKLNGKQIMPADVIQKCQTGYTKTMRNQMPFTGAGEYGLGWQIGQYNNEKVIYHHGGFPGYASHISFMPDKKIGVAVFVNEGGAGGRAGHMIATYAYDWWLQTANLEELYAKQLQAMGEAYENGKRSMVASAAERAKRVSQLTLPVESYTGKYNNAVWGTINVSNKDNSLLIVMGNINSVSTAFKEPETIRVEMIPGSGEVIRFKKNAENKIESLSYAGAEFVRVQ